MKIPKKREKKKKQIWKAQQRSQLQKYTKEKGRKKDFLSFFFQNKKNYNNNAKWEREKNSSIWRYEKTQKVRRNTSVFSVLFEMARIQIWYANKIRIVDWGRESGIEREREDKRAHFYVRFVNSKCFD